MDDIFRNGRGGGQARGLDARCVDKALLGRVDDEISGATNGSQAAEGGDGFSERYVADALLRFGNDVSKALLGSGFVLFVLSVHRGGAKE